ncbi:MAG: hypothetical protein IJU83_03360 [Clostridia bacterium]|nr:hypothetical protein [Clostridia bacterium]
MSFVKKIIVLKQATEGFSSSRNPACGICRLERENDFITAYLSLVGFSAITSGSFFLFIADGKKKIIEKDLGKIPTSAAFPVNPDLFLESGVSVGIWAVKDDIPLLVAFGKTDDFPFSVKDYGALIAAEMIAKRKLREREKEFAAKTEKSEPAPDAASERTSVALTAFPPVSEYDDEAVATENYYEKDEELKQKLYRVKEMCNEYVRRQDDDCFDTRPQKERESGKNSYFMQNETDDKTSQNAPYYLSVKQELDGIFVKYPQETALQKTFSDSRWAKIYYSEEKFYVVGLIKENGKEKYICYGVPSPYSPTPPKELAGYCCFVPLSVFDLKGDGYFMMFQDAATGRCVRKP